MDVMILAGFGITAALLTVAIRGQRPEMAIVLSLAAGISLILFISGKLSGVIDILRALADIANIPEGTIWLLARVVGISYLTEFAGQLCRDAGEVGIASKVELGGRLMVLTLAIPVLVSLMQMMLALVPGGSL
ncbi:MAG: stage III sporulation protein AD [Oscillospiraceae bacterium]|jgi:stage III sporulation protein AD|nr:stage III sporulation protein AD [Oscillospiraceae bacterium]